MLGITFSAEAEPSAAERISDCFQYFESRMDVIRLPRYCKVLDSIKIILSTAPDEKERKHISLKWREAEICVRLDGDTFMKASQDEQRDMVREAITRALEIIRKYGLIDRCTVFFSPVFGSIEPAEIVEFLKEHTLNGVRLQLQLHKFIWDPLQRGV